ncbi:MAG: hypothetical protein ABWZ76_13685 [Acidimicrobiales bacterium]
MIRRMIRQFGSVAIATFAWQHRGTVVRGLDLAKRVPDRVRDGRTHELAVEAKAIAALDGKLGDDTAIRISSVEGGTVTLHGDPVGAELEAARSSLLSLSDVIDVRTDNAAQPTLDTLLTEPTR